MKCSKCNKRIWFWQSYAEDVETIRKGNIMRMNILYYCVSCAEKFREPPTGPAGEIIIK